MLKKSATFLWTLIFCLLLSGQVQAAHTTLYRSVEQALLYSPRLQVLKHNRDAVKHELEQSRGEYLPSINMILGYGTDQHSDRSTRAVGADPADDDWDARGEASLSLTQRLYDGGVVKNRVSVRKALVDSADYRVFDNAQSIALDAIIAHLNVYRQRELVALSEKNVKIHQDILGSLEALRDAGAGSVADVTQVQGRLARAESSLYNVKADLASAEATYRRVIGNTPQQVGFAEVPKIVPATQVQALSETEKGNPKVLALGADLVEAEAREQLAEAAYHPKLNLELSTNYRDQVEGNPSWQRSNEAMLRMRWNLFSGGQDKYGIKAATSRKLQSRSNREDQLISVLEETTATWAQYQSAGQQVDAYWSAVKYSEQTLDSYLKQFNVAQRSLLDVLDAENEYFQSGGQLVTAAVNETIAAYRLLAYSGRLRVAEAAGAPEEEPDYLKALRNEIDLQKSAQVRSVVPAPVVLPSQPVAVDPTESSVNEFIELWADAWRTQDVERYLGYYSPDYQPERGRDLAAWEAFRRRRVMQPDSIHLVIKDLQVEALADGRQSVRFVQEYRSNLYVDQVQKTLMLEPWQDSWRILREIGVPPNS